MIWPHQDAFPFKQRIVIVCCAMSALVAALLPGLSWVQRVTSPLAVLLCFLLSYFFLRIVLAVLGLVRPVGVLYGFFVFYGMLVVCVTFVVLFPVIVFDPEISDPGERAYIVVSAVPGALGACAAVLATFRRWAMLANKPLVPTRTGEAPLLAAQRRRYVLKK